MNTMLNCLLTHRCTVNNFTESVVELRTTEVASTSTGVPCHVQVSFGDEVAKGFGYEREGDWDLWVSSTAPVAVGSRVTATSGPYSGSKWNVRAYKQASSDVGLVHKAFRMQLDTHV